MFEIRTFDGDLKEVSELIKTSWSEDYHGLYKQPVMDYANIDFLDWNLNKPDKDPRTLFGAYIGVKLVGFLGGFSVTFRYNDMLLKGVSGSFFTIHTEYKKMGIARTLMREATRQGIEAGIDISCSIPDEGHPMERVLETVCDEMKVGCLKPKRFTFLSKPLDRHKLLELGEYPLYQKIGLQLFTKRPGKIKSNTGGFEPENHVEPICLMLNESYRSDTLAVNWDDVLLSSQLRSQVSNTKYANAENRKGLINYFNIDLIGCRSPKKVHKMTMIDNVYFDNMSFVEKHKFVSEFCAEEKIQGSCVITIPTIPGFDLKPFYSNYFFPTGRYHTFFVQDLQNKLGKSISAGYLFVR